MSGKKARIERRAREAERQAREGEKYRKTDTMRLHVGAAPAKTEAERIAETLAPGHGYVAIQLWCPACHRKIKRAMRHPTTAGLLLARCKCKKEWKLTATPGATPGKGAANVQATSVDEIAEEVLAAERAPLAPPPEPEISIEEIAKANGLTVEEIRGRVKGIKAGEEAKGSGGAPPSGVHGAGGTSGRDPVRMCPVFGAMCSNPECAADCATVRLAHEPGPKGRAAALKILRAAPPEFVPDPARTAAELPGLDVLEEAARAELESIAEHMGKRHAAEVVGVDLAKGPDETVKWIPCDNGPCLAPECVSAGKCTAPLDGSRFERLKVTITKADGTKVEGSGFHAREPLGDELDQGALAKAPHLNFGHMIKACESGPECVNPSNCGGPSMHGTCNMRQGDNWRAAEEIHKAEAAERASKAVPATPGYVPFDSPEVDAAGVFGSATDGGNHPDRGVPVIPQEKTEAKRLGRKKCFQCEKVRIVFSPPKGSIALCRECLPPEFFPEGA